MTKHAIPRPVIVLAVLAVLALLVGGAQAALATPAAELPAADARAPAPAGTATVAASPVLAQTITLHAGWNAIYFEVEPENLSPLVNIGTTGEPVWVHEKNTLEAVFAGLTCNGCLESVWGWNVPLSRIDYIVDPTEGLWDAPGWRHYFPDDRVGPDGVATVFLTTLWSLHANTGYLVKLSDTYTGTATLQVTGRPLPQDRRWLPGSYQLAGFPVLPGASPTVSAFFAGSPVTKVHRLAADGRWQSLGYADTLRSGEAYLVFYDDQDPAATNDYTAPLHIMDPIANGFRVHAVAGGQSAVSAHRKPCGSYGDARSGAGRRRRRRGGPVGHGAGDGQLEARPGAPDVGAARRNAPRAGRAGRRTARPRRGAAGGVIG